MFKHLARYCFFLGNTCYANAVFQLFFSFPRLIELLSDEVDEVEREYPLDQPNPLATKLCREIVRMYHTRGNRKWGRSAQTDLNHVLDRALANFRAVSAERFLLLEYCKIDVCSFPTCSSSTASSSCHFSRTPTSSCLPS